MVGQSTHEGFLKRSWLEWSFLFLLVLGPLKAQGQAKEYQIKAVFLFNFAQFVVWPPGAFGQTNAPLRIGILGDDPFGKYLDDAIRGERIGEHPLVVQRYHRPEEIQNCQVLFVSPKEARRMKQILSGLRGRSILTVGEVDGFCRDGGMIRFVMVQNKIRMRINLEAAKGANLTLSSKLLRLAEIVEPGGD